MPSSTIIAATGIAGMPGISSRTHSAAMTSASALGTDVIWRVTSLASVESEAERVTMMPVPTAMTSAGTCVTMPSPMVSKV